jgi:hypothetical protein
VGRGAEIGRGFRIVAAGLLLVAAVNVRAADLSPSVPSFNPNLPVFGGGKFVNIFESDNAFTNASAHVAWSIAAPLIGNQLGGRKGLWIAGLSWIALSVTQESLFHAPPHPGPGYPSEVRADLLTRVVPAAAILVWDAMRGGGPPSLAPTRMRGDVAPNTEAPVAAPRPPSQPDTVRIIETCPDDGGVYRRNAAATARAASERTANSDRQASPLIAPELSLRTDLEVRLSPQLCTVDLGNCR